MIRLMGIQAGIAYPKIGLQRALYSKIRGTESLERTVRLINPEILEALATTLEIWEL